MSQTLVKLTRLMVWYFFFFLGHLMFGKRDAFTFFLWLTKQADILIFLFFYSRHCLGVELLVEQPFSLEMLTCLVELTRFETLIPRFSATVPPCWVEVQQEQQQRRHPQHLHQQHHGDAAQHTRTWKLQHDRYCFSLISISPKYYIEDYNKNFNGFGHFV